MANVGTVESPGLAESVRWETNALTRKERASRRERGVDASEGVERARSQRLSGAYRALIAVHGWDIHL